MFAWYALRMSKYPILSNVLPEIITSITQLRHQLKEQCVCYYLQNHALLEINTFTSKKKRELQLHPRKLFRSIICTSANQLLLIHNHPSNSCYPSHADLKATEILVEMGRFFEYQLLDHIIVTKTEYFSFEEAGLIENAQLQLPDYTKNHCA